MVNLQHCLRSISRYLLSARKVSTNLNNIDIFYVLYWKYFTVGETLFTFKRMYGPHYKFERTYHQAVCSEAFAARSSDQGFLEQSRQIDLLAGMTGEWGAWCSRLSKSVGRMAEKRELSPIEDRRRWPQCPSACVCFAHVFKQFYRQYWIYEGAGSSPVCAAGRDVCVSGKAHRPSKKF